MITAAPGNTGDSGFISARIPPRLLVVGELCADLVIQVGDAIAFGQHEQIVPDATLTMGSSSAITACAAAALEISTALVTSRGDDIIGTFLDAELTRRGVDTAHVHLHPGRDTGISTHLTRAGGDRAILTALGTIGTTTATMVSDELLASVDRVHIGSYFLQYALHSGGAASLFARAQQSGARTSLDGNFDPTMKWDSGIDGVLTHTDIFFGNEQEICGITGTTDLASGMRRVLDHLPDNGAVIGKLGERGAVALTRTGAWRCAAPSLPDAPLIDTIGAGDSLAAGVIAGLIRGDSLPAALELGVAAGTASTRGAGGLGASPNLAAVLALRDRARSQPYPFESFHPG